MPTTLSSLIEDVETRAPSPQPLDLLATASATVAEVTDLTDALLSHFVDRCRRAGHSWADIGGSLGVSKQAVQQRFTREARHPGGWERFTNRAKHVVETHAPAAADELEHGWIGTEHLLLGLWGEPGGLALRALEQLGVQRDQVVAGIEARVERSGQGRGGQGRGGFTPRAWVAIENTIRIAIELGHNYVGTEHLLLSLLDGVGGMAEEILTELSVTSERVRPIVVEMLAGYTAKHPPSS